MPIGAWAQLSALNQKLTINQKLSLLTLGTVIFFGIWAFVYLFNQDHYQLLVSDLDADDVSSVVEKLKQEGVPYELAQGGRSVLVPPQNLNEARIDIASQGLPENGRIGFEIFDQNNWSMSEFTEKVNYLRALQGELEKTILGLSEISHARVHLVLGKDSLFTEEKQPAKASVIIRLRPGSNLPPNRIAGVTNLVAFAVEGLAVENVTVVDDNGNVLSHSPSDGEETNMQADLRTRIEQELSQKVISTLEPLVGKEKVRATSSVLLDQRETEQTEEIFDPQGTVILSQQRTQDSLSDTSPAGGVPGTTSNQEGDAGLAIAREAGSERFRTTELVNYEVSKTVRHVTTPRGVIQRVSLAVVVDDAVETSTDEDGESVQTTRPRSAEEMEQFRKVVSAVVGFDEERGDTLTVENISFQEIVEESPLLTPKTFLQQYRNLLLIGMRYLSIIALFLLFYFLIFRPLKKKLFASLEFSDPEFAQLAAATGDDAMVHQLQDKLAALKSSSPALLEGGKEVAVLDHRQAQIKRQLAELASKEPSTVTQLIKSWLAQDT